MRTIVNATGLGVSLGAVAMAERGRVPGGMGLAVGGIRVPGETADEEPEAPAALALARGVPLGMGVRIFGEVSPLTSATRLAGPERPMPAAPRCGYGLGLGAICVGSLTLMGCSELSNVFLTALAVAVPAAAVIIPAILGIDRFVQRRERATVPVERDR